MKYQKLCEDIIKNVGGKENVASVTHCVTRLRFKLHDESKADTETMKKTEGVLQVITTGGQYQVVVGTAVDEIYADLLEVGGFESQAPVAATEEEDEKSGNIFSRFLVMMTGIFQPVLSMLMASGMIKAVLSLLTVSGMLSTKSGTYTVLYAIGDGFFYFLPIALGWSCAKKFGLKEIYGIALGAVLEYPTITALATGKALGTAFAGTIIASPYYVKLFGIPMILPGAGYTGSVIPIILVTYFAAVLYKYFNKHLPSMLKSFFTPFLTIAITMPVAFLIIGPVAMIAQGLLGTGIKALIGLNAGVAGFILGTFWSVIVVFGLHMPIIMMFAVNIKQYGYDIINPLIFSGALASMGAVLGIIIRTKKTSEKNIAIPALISSFFGINEPALYGVLLPRRKVMITSFLSAGVGAAIAGFCGSKLYSFGASGPLGLPCFINPNGIDIGFIGLVVGAIISFVLALVCALVIGDKKDNEKA